MKEIGIGFWGLGMIGKTHLEALRLMQVMFPELPEITMDTLCTRTQEAYKKKLFCNVTNDSQQMLESDRVSLIDIPSPNFAHYEQTKQALAHKKNVYLEKPLAVELAEAAELVTLAEQSGLVNRVAFIYRFVPAVAAMREMIQAGNIGEVIHFSMKFYHYSYMDTQRPSSWRQQAKLSGGGSMMDLGIHFTDIIRWVFGEVESVAATQRTVVAERYIDATHVRKIPNDTEEWCSATLRMQSGVAGVLESSRVSAHIDSGTILEVFGTTGSLRFDVSRPEVLQRFDLETEKIETISRLADAGPYSRFLARMVPPPRNDSGFFLNAHIASYKSVLEAITGDVQNPSQVTFREAYEAQRIVAMIMCAATENRIVFANEFPAALNPTGELV